MSTESATMDDNKEKNCEAEAVKEEQPQPKVEVDKLPDTLSPLNQQPSNPTPESNGEEIDAGQSSLTIYRIHEMYVRVSQPSSFESLCTRILEDGPDDEDFLPPVVDFSVVNMCPGWYRSLCASPYCHGDL